MPRPARLHLAGGTYYLLQLSNADRLLFAEDADYAQFELRLTRSLRRTHMQALAFAWLPHAIHLAVRCGEVSISRFMQGLTSSYARYRHRFTGEVGHAFRQRFQSILIDPRSYLPELVRYIHYTPVRARLTHRVHDYPHSSASIYSGRRTHSWLDTEAVLTALRARGIEDGHACAFLLEAPPEADLALFDTDHHADARVLGGLEFRAQLPYAYRRQRRTLSLERLIAHVVTALAIDRAELFTRSRRRRIALARSVIAWHARELKLASLTEVSNMLGRDVSTLSKAIPRHRKHSPELFKLDAFRHLFPLP